MANSTVQPMKLQGAMTCTLFAMKLFLTFVL